MLLINVKIALVVILITPVSLFVASFIAKRTYVFFKAQSETRAQMTSLVDEMVGNQKVVQAFGYGDRAVERFDTINKKLQKSACRRFSFRPLRIRVPGLSTDWCIQGLVLQVRLPQSEAGSRWGSCLAF